MILHVLEKFLRQLAETTRQIVDQLAVGLDVLAGYYDEHTGQPPLALLGSLQVLD